MPPSERLQQAHDDMVTAVIARLKSYKSTSRLVGDRVYLPSEVPASPTLPYLIVSKGKNHGHVPANVRTSVQMDFRVEARDDDEEGVPILTQAVQGAVSGWAMAPALHMAILTDTGTVSHEDGYYARRDAFGGYFDQYPAAEPPETPAERSRRLRAEADALDAANP